MPSFKNISKWIIFLLILYRNILDETRKTFFSFKPIDFLISIYINWFCDVKFNPISMKKKQTSVRRHLNALPFISSLCFFILDFHWPSPVYWTLCSPTYRPLATRHGLDLHTIQHAMHKLRRHINTSSLPAVLLSILARWLTIEVRHLRLELF